MLLSEEEEKTGAWSCMCLELLSVTGGINHLVRHEWKPVATVYNEALRPKVSRHTLHLLQALPCLGRITDLLAWQISVLSLESLACFAPQIWSNLSWMKATASCLLVFCFCFFFCMCMLRLKRNQSFLHVWRISYWVYVSSCWMN